ncbi:alanine/glycine:cation symporter family protein [Lentibacillus sp. N15]|uniref:alanine/glycine:cation symporter family protein n=1 Tax=Lentibacillus songyuanensis TaxID=3136161 RepID=UPI0031BBC9BA
MMNSFMDWLSGLVWNQFFIFSFLAIGLLFTIITKFVQVTQIKDMIRFTFTGGSSKSGVSSFQALSMSLGSRVGTGNIAGVVTAISLGGPGAVFWMWVMAFLGAATSFVEVTLAQIFKSKLKGEYRGGPPFFMDKGLGLKKLAIAYAILTIIANGFLLMNIQSNTVAIAMEDAFGINRLITGLILVAVFALIVFGGVKRIAKTAELAVPFMAIGYILLALILIFANFSAIPEVFRIIVSSAFGADATFGGLIGSAISWGIQRGYFSNAAGSGGETFEGAAAEVSHPAKQGLVQSFAVYIDTWIICSMTAFMVIITGMYNVEGAGVNNIPGVVAGGTNVQFAIDTIFAGWGKAFLAIALLFFCFTTMISYYYKSETSLSYINVNKERPWTNYLMKFGIMIFVFEGTIISAEAAWTAGDIGLGSMAYLNLFTLLFLFKYSVVALNDYKAQKKAGKDPVFDPIKLGIKNADFWEGKNKNNEEDSEKIG